MADGSHFSKCNAAGSLDQPGCYLRRIPLGVRTLGGGRARCFEGMRQSCQHSALAASLPSIENWALCGSSIRHQRLFWGEGAKEISSANQYTTR